MIVLKFMPGVQDSDAMGSLLGQLVYRLSKTSNKILVQQLTLPNSFRPTQNFLAPMSQCFVASLHIVALPTIIFGTVLISF
jgi:hypothetical protein